MLCYFVVVFYISAHGKPHVCVYKHEVYTHTHTHTHMLFAYDNSLQ